MLSQAIQLQFLLIMWDHFYKTLRWYSKWQQIITYEIIGFTETQIKPSDSAWKIIETLNLFNINVNNNESKFWICCFK